MMTEETRATLVELVDTFGQEKELADTYKKSCDKKNAQIKDIMRESGDEEFSSDNYAVKFSSYNKDSLNEDLAIKVLKESSVPQEILSKIIVTKEVLDTDALERFMYDGTVAPTIVADLQKCVEQKLVETLRITKNKAKKTLNE